MSRMLNATEALETYVRQYGAREIAAQIRCRNETARLAEANMQIGPDQGAFMALLVRLIGARRCLEIGTFTGYSAMSVALALPEDGMLVALDVSKDYTDMARGFWAEAGVANKIELRLGPAAETLAAMTAAKEAPFDFVFIDADKSGYDTYYELVLKLLRPGGLIMFDNMLWSGAVADPGNTDAQTEAIRAVNRKVHEDSRVDMALTTVGDGVLLARKR